MITEEKGEDYLGTNQTAGWKRQKKATITSTALPRLPCNQTRTKIGVRGKFNEGIGGISFVFP